jgi:hypothetical protein
LTIANRSQRSSGENNFALTPVERSGMQCRILGFVRREFDDPVHSRNVIAATKSVRIDFEKYCDTGSERVCDNQTFGLGGRRKRNAPSVEPAPNKTPTAKITFFCRSDDRAACVLRRPFLD